MTVWRELTLENLCSLKAGFAFKLEHQGQTDGELPFIKVSDMNDPGNEIAIRHSRHRVGSALAEKLRLRPLPAGTVAFAKIGEALKQNRVRQIVAPTIVDNNMMGAVPNEAEVDPKYFYYLLSTFDFAATATGTALPYLTLSVLYRARFRVPDISTQRHIGSVLSAYDDLIEVNQRRIAILEEMARRLFEEWFVRFRFPGQEAEPDSDHLDQGSLPPGWRKLPVSALANVRRGRSYKGTELVDEAGYPS